MNAAARALAQGSLVGIDGRSLTFSRQTIGMILLVIAVLTSALAVVYVKALDRQMFSDLQALQQVHDDLHVQSGQLLLEQNTWAAPARVQVIAEQQLNMIEPTVKEVTLVTINKAQGENNHYG